MSAPSRLQAGEESAFPKWNGKESVEQYAQRANLPATKTLDLGGVKLEAVLVPAGDFLMGASEPAPVDEAAFQRDKLTGQIVLSLVCAALLFAPLFILIRAFRRKVRPQYSLAQLMLISLIASSGIWGGIHWYQAVDGLKKAQAAYESERSGFTEASDDEKPVHSVTLSRPFYMGKYHVTQEQYQKVMGENPSRFAGANLPVDKVKWESAKEFCKKAGAMSGQPVRLPTEAEWEFACRAGTMTLYYTGDAESDLDRAAWFYKNSDKMSHPVGQKLPNKFGLYDMLGNNWHWCQKYAPQSHAEELAETAPEAVRVIRGGSWDDAPKGCRATSVFRYFPDNRPLYIGFRVVVPVAVRTRQ